MGPRVGWLCAGAAVAALLVLQGPEVGAAAPDPGGCVTFVGDVVLSRGVKRELQRRGVSPWGALARAGPFIGNLEGAVRDGECQVQGTPCLSIEEEDLAWLKTAPFVALSLANNHSHDHGAAGYRRTAQALSRLGLRPLTEADAPALVQVGGRTWALVPINLANRPAAEWPAALLRARLQIGLGRAHTPWVVVLPHWGREYDPHPVPEQERLAALFHEWGALLVIGAHAHVPQDSTCAAGGADYFGLGDHLFDQPYPGTWRGQMVRCCPQGDAAGLACTTSATSRTSGSTFPALAQGPQRTCQLAPPPAQTAWLRHPAHERFVYVQPYASLGPDTFFALHRRYSSFDKEEALRPYVFRVTGPGAIVDVWRGTALSRPLLAARLFQVGPREYLCAIHRGDSFLRPDPATRLRRYTVYQWSGFGFHGVDDADALERCQRM